MSSIDVLGPRLRRIARWAGGVWAFYLKDLRNGESLGIREREAFPSASIIKLPILLRVLERVGRGEVSLDDTVTLTAWHKTGGSGIFQHFREGTVFRLEDACMAMTVLSDNTATNLAIDVAGVEGTNRFLEAAGCERTRLHRYFGKPEMPGWGRAEGPSQAVPAEMGLLLEGLARGELAGLTPDLCRRALVFLRKQQHRALAPRLLPEGTVMAHKTGSLDGLRHDVGVLWLPERGERQGGEQQDVMALPSDALPCGMPVVFVAMSRGVSDPRWTVENRAEVAIGRAARAVYDALS
ncbi:MAG TPA: serine hydrolase [Chloroflexota bacterium]|nr:serine hydrolase [Chloroflexota bacterium]